MSKTNLNILPYELVLLFIFSTLDNNLISSLNRNVSQIFQLISISFATTLVQTINISFLDNPTVS